jgi:hypothetical protein
MKTMKMYFIMSLVMLTLMSTCGKLDNNDADPNGGGGGGR